MGYYVCKIAFDVCRIGCDDVWWVFNMETLTATHMKRKEFWSCIMANGAI